MLENNLSPIIPLDGVWRVRTPLLGESGELLTPGCWEAQGLPKTLDGPVGYQREVFIPPDWSGHRVSAEFDAVSYAATVRCNGVYVGEHLGLWTPFAIDLTHALRPGAPNLLEVEVVKPCHQLTGGQYPLRTTLAGFLPDVATSFGGVWQSARLRQADAGVRMLHVTPDPASSQVRVQAEVIAPIHAADLSLILSIRQGERLVAATEIGRFAQPSIDASLTVAKPVLWQPDQPALYSLHLELRQGDRPLISVHRRFAFRRLHAHDEQLFLNGQPICLRGALSWGWNPESIAPLYSAAAARDEIRHLRALGFNLIKLCLVIPNQAYYDVADEEGMLLWQEWPMWLPDVTPDLRARAPGEYAAYMELTRHHPSVVIYSMGCELDQSVDRSLLQQLDGVVRSAAAGALICDNSGSGEAYGGLAEDFADFTDYHTYGDLHYLELTLDHWRRDWQRPRPWLFGEFCDSDGFRDRAQVIAANNGETPWWMTTDNPICTWRPEARALVEMEQRLAQVLPRLLPADLLAIANAQSLMTRKWTLETIRKRSAVQGYVITGLRDTPIATSGILDDFGQPKWTPEQFRPFNDAAILMLDVGRRRIWRHGGDRPERLDAHNWWAGETVHLHILLHHCAGRGIARGALDWRLLDGEGQELVSGAETVNRSMPAGRPGEVCAVEFAVPLCHQPTTLVLEARFHSPKATCANRWLIWVYPRVDRPTPPTALYDPHDRLDEEWIVQGGCIRQDALDDAAGVVISTTVNDDLRAFLRAGGRALLVQTDDGSLPVLHAPFWREALKILSPHPLWRRFPNAGFVDLQFWGLATDVSFHVDQLDRALPGVHACTPILRRLDARLFTVTDYLFSAEVGNGRLIACSLRLQGGAGAQPTGLRRNAAGRFLLRALLDYLAYEDVT
jgi:hypothetical protein